MSETIATKQAVFAAADQLEANGQAQTVAAVTDLIKGGSATTVGAHLKEWKAEQALRKTAMELAVPAEIEAVFAELRGRVWSVAKMEGQRTADIVTQQLKTAEKKLGQAAFDVQQQDTALKERADQLERERTERIALEKRVNELDRETAVLREKISGQDRDIQRLEAAVADAKAQRDDMKSERDRVRQEVAQLRSGSAAA
ncbi:DNA-binding protein [Cereibacter sp. SYSU M97828]|nr:DNA-binding protein [Cereibacter flavus]